MVKIGITKTKPADSVMKGYFIIDKTFFTVTFTYNNNYKL